MNRIEIRDISDTSIPFYSEIIANIPGDIRQRLDLMKSEKRALESKASYILLASMLSSLLGRLFIPQINYDKKPFLLNSNLYFNISHSASKCACIISDCECGIDIEKIKSIDSKMYNYVLNDKERDYVNNSSNRDESFIEIWTKKEAYIKLYGGSISSKIKMINTREYKYETIKIDDYICSSIWRD